MMRTSAAPDRTLLIVSFSSQIFAIDRSTGQVRWEVALGAYGESDIHVIDGVVIAVTNHHVVFVDYLTGHEHTRVNLDVKYERRPTSLVDQGHLYVGANGELVCFTLRGERVWHQPFTGKGMGSIAIALPGNARQADDVGSK